MIFFSDGSGWQSFPDEFLVLSCMSWCSHGKFCVDGVVCMTIPCLSILVPPVYRSFDTSFHFWSWSTVWPSVAFRSPTPWPLHLSHLESLRSLYPLISPSRFVLCLTIFFLGWIVYDALTDYNYEGFGYLLWSEYDWNAFMLPSPTHKPSKNLFMGKRKRSTQA